MSNKILVTGATGFLGRHLAPLLVARGYAVRALVRPTSDTAFLDSLPVELAIAGDITDADGLARACTGCQAAIHAAGEFRFWGAAEAFHRTNVEGTRTFLETARAAGLRRVVHVSTIAVAGRIPPGQVIDETFPCDPQDPYQHSKLAAEVQALAHNDPPAFEVVVVRPGAYYGPGGRYGFNRLFFEEPLRGWRIRVDGGRHIQFPAFVPDVARGVLLALEKGRPGEIYNLCGESLSHNEANAIISRLAGISPRRFNAPRAAMLTLAWLTTRLAALTGREPFYPFNLRHYVFQDWRVSSEKARTELGFEPTPFEKGARQTLAWYRGEGTGNGERGTGGGG